MASDYHFVVKRGVDDLNRDYTSATGITSDDITAAALATKATTVPLSWYGLVANDTSSAVGLANLAKIRQAMSEAPEGATLLFSVPSGGGYYYIENDGVSALTPTKHLVLAGPAGFPPAVKLKFGPNDPTASMQMFLTTAGKNLTLSDLWIEGPDTNSHSVAAIHCVKDAADSTTSAVDGGAGITTIRRCAITKFTHGCKLQGDDTLVTTNRRLRIIESYIKAYGNNNAIVVCVLTGASGEVIARDSTFDMQLAGIDSGTVNAASHNFYLNPGTSLDAQGCNFIQAAGYHINSNNAPAGTPKYWRVVDCTFQGTPTGAIQTNPWQSPGPGTDSPTTLVQGCSFLDTAGTGITVQGDCHILDNDFSGLRSASGSDVQTFAATTVATVLINGNRFRNRVRIISPYCSFYIRNNRFVPSFATSGPAVMTTSAANGTPGTFVLLESNVFEGSAGATSQVTIQGGTCRSRRNIFHNKNNASQKLVITGTPTGGTFTLSFGGQTTSAIAYNADANAVQTALVALSTIGTAGIAVAPITPNSTNGGVLPGCAYEMTFINTNAGAAQSTITADSTNLTGGSSPAAAVTSVVTGGNIGTASIIVQNAGTVIDGGGDSFDDVDVFDVDSKAFSISLSATGTYKAQKPGTFGANISSGSTITVPWATGIVHITGTSTINTINVVNSGTLAGIVGTDVRFIFDSTAALGTSGNIATAFTGSAGAMKLLIWDGSKWQG